MRVDLRDALTGLLLLGVACAFAVSALKRLALGTPSAMGPGFFPVMVAAGLGCVALLIFARSLGGSGRIEGRASLRALACVLGSPVLFALAIAPLGFVPALAAAAMLAAWGSSLMTLRFAVVLTGALTALCTLLFVQLLKMPVALFGPWLGA
jgi:hypothetical protein